MFKHRRRFPLRLPEQLLLHPVSVRRFPCFRTQPLENLSVDSVNNGFLSTPAPGENLLSGNLVMETGCTVGLVQYRYVHRKGNHRNLVMSCRFITCACACACARMRMYVYVYD